jgi:hypothetical protein
VQVNNRKKVSAARLRRIACYIKAIFAGKIAIGKRLLISAGRMLGAATNQMGLEDFLKAQLESFTALLITLRTRRLFGWRY